MMVARGLPQIVPSIPLAGLVLSAIGVCSAVHGQCNYEVTAIIQAPPCPPPFNDPPPTIGTALTEGPDAAVVGFYYPCGASTANSAFVWRASTGVITLPRPAGVGSMQASDISESGAIVGTYDAAERGFRGFVYENGVFTELPPDPRGLWSMASAINNAGQAVGYRSIGDGVNPLNAFIWSESDGFLDLGLMGEQETYAADISEAGEVVGRRGFAVGNDEGFLWENGEMTFLGPIPGGFTSNALAINENRQIVGAGLLQDAKTGELLIRPFLWEEGAMLLLPSLPGEESCGAHDINDFGQIIGFCSSSENPNIIRAFLSQSGVTYDLNAVVAIEPPPVIDRARAINNAGQIIADGKNLRGDNVTFLLTPIDRPLGDINIDCEVGVADLIILINNWSQTDSPGDLNIDGVVNVLDLIIMLLNFGS